MNKDSKITKSLFREYLPAILVFLLWAVYLIKVNYNPVNPSNTDTELWTWKRNWYISWETTSWGTIASWLNVNITLTGGALTWWSITWTIEKSDEEKYIQYKESWNFRSFFPPKQNRIGGDYATNTQLMNAYLSHNTFQFLLPEEVYTGYLYIRLKNPTTSWIFIYRYGSNKNGYAVSGDLDKEKSLINSETELLYKLDDIPYIRFHDKKSDTYNRLSQMKLWTNNNFIAWFVRDYDWSNKIEEMTIAWE